MMLQHLQVVVSGGVCVGSPIAGIHRYEKLHGLPFNYINVAIVNQGDHGAFQKLERSEIKLVDFYKAFGDELSDPKNKLAYRKYLEKSGKSAPKDIPDIAVDGKELWDMMMNETERVDPIVMHAIHRLKDSGRFITAALTNNSETAQDQNKTSDSLRKIFDYFIESKVVGLRKPDPKFYLHACKTIGVEPHETVFLDDIGMNLRAAKKLGMKTIHVKLGRSEEAIKTLAGLVNLDLHDSSNSKL
ncbi:epoxide hydrolase [Lichtheimia corymbifera JMRC:FSU:9682]|uniref:Epoxide hydrolase n=1 Tax=Lichtheimia corymbifera JMRC:FSU:9682 TaxID=1263082 RepID=A0A068RET3_9FUNG|nr:epoxide hydrolase [Lichtheimia corymbifera JMRC:FSU:9682]